MDQRGREGRIKGSVWMFLERPDRVRFDAMTQLGPAAILTSDGQQFALTDLREDRYLTGPTCPANIARLLGAPFSGAELARFLVGDTPYLDATSRRFECTSQGTYRVDLEASDGRHQIVEIDIREADRRAPPQQQRLRLVRSELRGRDGARIWRVRFDDYEVVRDAGRDQGVAMPLRIHFEDFRHDADVLVRFKRIDLNIDVPEAAFKQTPRPGLVPEHVGCESDDL